MCIIPPMKQLTASSFTGCPRPVTFRSSAIFPSTILSRPIEVSRFGLIYAGAQKNIGPAGVTLVIVRDDLIGDALPVTPGVFDYAQQAKADSMLNTRPTYSLYVAGLSFNG